MRFTFSVKLTLYTFEVYDTILLQKDRLSYIFAEKIYKMISQAVFQILTKIRAPKNYVSLQSNCELELRLKIFFPTKKTLPMKVTEDHLLSVDEAG